jgi:hypothetical protein
MGGGAVSGAIGIGCCWLVAVVFAISATGKLRNRAVRAAFRRSVRDMAVLPAGAVRPVAVAAPVGEAATAVLLAIPATAVVGCVLAFVLLGAFTAGIATVLRRGTSASCLCFGTTERPYSARHLVRNALLGAAALAGALLYGIPVEAPAALLAIAAGGVAALVVVTFDELLDLFGTPAQQG